MGLKVHFQYFSIFEATKSSELIPWPFTDFPFLAKEDHMYHVDMGKRNSYFNLLVIYFKLNTKQNIINERLLPP